MEAEIPLQKGLSRDRFTNLLNIPLKVSSGMQCKSHIFAFDQAECARIKHQPPVEMNY